jgi:hypothetical protein
MIRTKKEIYNLRDSGKSAIYVEITEEITDKENNQFIFNVIDYVIENDNKKIINTKIVNMSYQERDALKDAVMQTQSLQGTESEVNKILMPFALLFITTQKPIYNTKGSDWELME